MATLSGKELMATAILTDRATKVTFAVLWTWDERGEEAPSRVAEFSKHRFITL